MKQAVILCGGRGSRLRPYTDHIPKPMVLCGQYPFLWYLLDQLSHEGIKRFLLLTGYKGDCIRDYFQDGARWGWFIEYSHGPIEWDTGERVWNARTNLDESFLLLYGDNFSSFNLKNTYSIHTLSKASITLGVCKRVPGNIELSNENHVKKYTHKRSQSLQHIEIGYMIINRDEVLKAYKTQKCNFSSVLEVVSQMGQMAAWVNEAGYHSIGDVERWHKAQRYLAPKKIILLDRDGVINDKPAKGDYVKSWREFKLLSSTVQSLKLLASNGYKFIVITNQAGVSRGFLNMESLDEIHSNLIESLAKDGIEILKIYACIHHWDEKCLCRKPMPGMFYQASNDFEFRLDQAFYIGDQESDRQAAQNAGCKFIGVDPAIGLEEKLIVNLIEK